jgi:hypothetical protein
MTRPRPPNLQAYWKTFLWIWRTCDLADESDNALLQLAHQLCMELARLDRRPTRSGKMMQEVLKWRLFESFANSSTKNWSAQWFKFSFVSFEEM